MNELSAHRIVEQLGMVPHPEGGHYVETFRDRPRNGGRGACTAIYYLLEAGEVSAWHRIDAIEIWHWYAGATLALTLSTTGSGQHATHLGPRLEAGEQPQVVVPALTWQTAKSLGAWTLV